MKRSIYVGLTLLPLCSVNYRACSQAKFADENYLKQFNRINKPMGKDYYSSLFLGNGLLGAMVWQKSDSALQIQIGRSDVTDTRIDPAEDTVGMALYNRARLPIGYFTLHTAGKILAAEQTLDIYKAVIKAIIFTDLGKIELNARVPTGEQVIVADWKTSEKRKQCILEVEPRYSHQPQIPLCGKL